MYSVIKSWVFTLPLRMQSVLMAAVRGADGFSKEDKSKHLVRSLRGLLFNNADPTNSFIKDELTDEQVEAFASDIDHYYVHFLMHFTHATEIVGYKHPDHMVRNKWIFIYKRICKSLHLNFETEPQLDIRLGHTPEFLEEQKREIEAKVKETPIPPPKARILDPELKKKSLEDRPLELDDGPVPAHIEDPPENQGKCECGHEHGEHYWFGPKVECSTGKCKCEKYRPPPKPLPKNGKSKPNNTNAPPILICICGHAEIGHSVPNFSGTTRRCSHAGCGCERFTDREEARRTGDAGTGTSRYEGRGRGSS